VNRSDATEFGRAAKRSGVGEHGRRAEAACTPSEPERERISAVLWDFGGVILASPFEAFRHYEAARGLPADFIRTVNAAEPHANAWARLERSEITAEVFDAEFARESAALGHEVRGADLLELLAGDIRVEMVTALDRVRAAGLATACLTNNIVGLDGDARPELLAVMARFDVVLESSKLGVRKPEPAFYSLACERLGVAPEECVFLDDLGVNLKPAREMGMATIKVGDPAVALAELGGLLGLDLS
jgi:putative hydrolase of the HAD superfamily